MGVFATKQVDFGEFGGENDESRPKKHLFLAKARDNPSVKKGVFRSDCFNPMIYNTLLNFGIGRLGWRKEEIVIFPTKVAFFGGVWWEKHGY